MATATLNHFAHSSVSRTLLRPIQFRDSDLLKLEMDADGLHYVATITSREPEFYQVSYNAQEIFPQRIPEHRRLHHKHQWQFAATDITSLVIHALWPKEQIEFQDELSKTIFTVHMASLIQQNQNTRTVAEYKAHKQLPGKLYYRVNWADSIIEERYEYQHTLHDIHPLSAYQKVGLHCSLNDDGYALFMEQGTGKTAIVVANVCNKAARPENKRPHRVLIACPKNVRSNWVDEFEKFATCNGKVTVLRGDKIKRIDLLLSALLTEENERFTAVICSYESMTRMAQALKAIEWDLMVLDESHFIKWPETKRTKAALVVRDSALNRMCLTGTPIANTPLDIYSQLEFLGRGSSGFLSWKAFKDFYGVWEPGRYGDKMVGLQNLPFMKERLAQKTFIIKKEEALPDLPDKVHDIVEIVMHAAQRQAYDDIRKHLMLEIENDLGYDGPNKQLVINNVLVKLLRLAQITSGFISWDGFDNAKMKAFRDIEYFDPNPKLEAAVELLKEKGPNDKTIIWACFQPDIIAMQKRFQQENIDAVTFYGQTSDAMREHAVWRFNNDTDCKVFVGNPGAGGTGLNLLGYPPLQADKYQTNCNHLIYYSQDWSSPKRSQSEDRAHRRGTREPVRITDLCVAGTIDEEIRTRVLKKRTIAWEVSDIRSILTAVLKGVIDDED